MQIISNTKFKLPLSQSSTRLRWGTTKLWVTITAILFVACLFNMSSLSEFLIISFSNFNETQALQSNFLMLIFLSSFLIVSGFMIWLEPYSGDLTRIGAFQENEYGWNHHQKNSKALIIKLVVT